MSTNIDWSGELETIPYMGWDKPRVVRVVGEHRGAQVDYVDIMIEGDDDYWHPAGAYCAEKVSGHVRGTLAVRNRHAR